MERRVLQVLPTIGEHLLLKLRPIAAGNTATTHSARWPSRHQWMIAGQGCHPQIENNEFFHGSACLGERNFQQADKLVQPLPGPQRAKASHLCRWRNRHHYLYPPLPVRHTSTAAPFSAPTLNGDSCAEPPTRKCSQSKSCLATPALPHPPLAPLTYFNLQYTALSPDHRRSRSQSWHQRGPSRKGETSRRCFPAIQKTTTSPSRNRPPGPV